MSPATSRRALWPVWSLALVAVLLLLGWTRALWVGWLLGSVAAFAGALWQGHVRREHLAPASRRWYLAGLAALGIGLMVAGVAHWRFELIEFRWDRLSRAREEKLADQLSARMEQLKDNGQAAALAAALEAADTASRRPLFDDLARVRRATRVDALAVFSNSGALIAWAGEHRGRIPDAVRLGARTAHFEERPLFSYLYFMQPVPGRSEHVAAALLIETGLGEVGDAAQAQPFHAQIDERVTFHSGQPRVPERRIWGLIEGSDTVVQAWLRPVTQAQRRAEVERAPRRLGVLFGTLAFVLFAISFLTAGVATRAASYAPLLALVPLLALAPLGDVLGVRTIFQPAAFVLPGDLTLGRVLLLLLPLAALIGALRKPGVGKAALVPVLLSGGVAVALAYPGALTLLIDAATRPLLESSSELWVALQLVAVLVLTSVTSLALPRVLPVPAGQAHPRAPVLAFGGALLATAMGALLALYGSPVTPTTRWAALWAVPFLLVALGTMHASGRAGALRRFLFAGWLAVTAVLPHLWTAQVHARLQSAAEEIGTLGTQEDPYLDYLLEEFGRQAEARVQAGEEGVQLLYRTWVASGLAREAYPVRIALWSPDNLLRFQLGSYTEEVTPSEGTVLLGLLEESRAYGAADIYPYRDQPHMSRVLAVPLPEGDVITVLVPPRRTFGRPTGVALFFGTDQGTALRNLVPAREANPVDQPIRWLQARGGWRAQALVQYPDGKYYAHVLVSLPARGVWLARAVILSTLDLLLLLALWGLGVFARGSSPLPRGGIAGVFGTFRARVTLALFAFFLIPTVVFGYVAYHALAQEVERATQVVAQRAANQAVREFPSLMGDLRALAQHANTDVLFYQEGGELTAVSSEEAFELGVYGAWMPPLAYAQIRSGEEEGVVDVQRFAGQPYVTAYNALQPSGTLAVPMPLVSGDIAVRQRELAHLIIFAAILGALLSLALSVAVGRALAGPIGLLRRASAAVGAGRLRVRLPEEEGGEFGQVFTSFNRMVTRLRRARARELRSARVLAWGEMARQVAHEIKNPLTPIKLSVQHLRRAHQDRHPDFERILDGSVQEILREIDRLSEIARAFSRYGAPAAAAGPLEAVDVASVLQEALTLYRTGDEGVRYDAVVDPGIPRVQARTGELKEVLLNLLENARAALDGDGRIIVRALAQDERIELEVEDDGGGIAPDLLPRIFEPHFSTRSTGTGLGLAIVRRLVESWGGTIAVDSRAGGGTTVRLRLLPAAPSAQEHHGTR